MNTIITFESFSSPLQSSNESRVYYHGRSGTTPYYGNYIFITDSLEYAMNYAGSDNKIYKATMLIDTSTLFSILNKDHMARLSHQIDDGAMRAIITQSKLGKELDWSMSDYISNDDYELPEELLEHMGFKGMYMQERSNIDSIMVFDQTDVSLSELDM